jgi:hypothetical protein
MPAQHRTTMTDAESIALYEMVLAEYDRAAWQRDDHNDPRCSAWWSAEVVRLASVLVILWAATPREYRDQHPR